MGLDHSMNLPPGLLTRGDDPGAAYAQLLIDTYGASEVWRLTDIESGTTIPAQINSARDGTLTGWTLQDAASPVTGELLKAPYSDGVNDIGNIFTSGGGVGLADIADMDQGGMFGWFKIPDANPGWQDANYHALIELFAGGAYTFIYKWSQANRLRWSHINVVASPVTDFSTDDWFSVALTWDNTAPRRAAFHNGNLVDAITTSFTPSSVLTEATIGVRSGPTFALFGNMAYVAVWFGTVPTDADILALHNAAS